MPPRRFLRPYAAKAIIEHEFDTDHLNIFITFRFSMDESVKPANGLWLCEVDDVLKAVTISAWQDAWTLLLTVPNIAVLPDRVTLEYDGPDENLRITWDKQWEPWGPIVSVELPPVLTTRIFSTGPAPQDDVDVSNVGTLFIDAGATAITIGGFVGGVNGQTLNIVIIDPANNVTLEHHEGGGNQDLLLHRGADETIDGHYGGWAFVCHAGNDWHDTSHAKHV